jgi:putative transcriptional regulator
MKSSATSVKSRRPNKAKRDKYGMTPEDWARFDSMTDEEVTTRALADPDAQPMSKERLARAKRISPAKFARQKLAMTQEAFAETFRIPLGTLRDWEQHRREPDQAARAYLEVIARAPDIVRKALAEARESAPAG